MCGIFSLRTSCLILSLSILLPSGFNYAYAAPRPAELEKQYQAAKACKEQKLKDDLAAYRSLLEVLGVKNPNEVEQSCAMQYLRFVLDPARFGRLEKIEALEEMPLTFLGLQEYYYCVTSESGDELQVIDADTTQNTVTLFFFYFALQEANATYDKCMNAIYPSKDAQTDDGIDEGIGVEEFLDNFAN